MRFHLFVTLCLIAPCLTLPASNAHAQRGDKQDQAGEEQPEVWKAMDVPAAPVLSPEEALAAFKTAPGYRVELVASEPLVVDPVAMTWDERGRLWVVEMRGYMPTVDAEGEDQPLGQIVVLEDDDHDGAMDRSTVFLDQLVMPRAIAIVEGGVLVGEPPNLWYCRDTDDDLKCDEKTVVFDRYGVQGPVEHTDNALMYGLDNHLYNAKSNKRIRFADGQATVEEDIFRGQWGMTRDNYGRLLTNSNSNYLFGDFIPGRYATRNPAYDRVPGVNAVVIPYKDVHSIRVNPGVNRGYREQTLRADGRLAGITAVSGLAMNRAHRYAPEMTNAVFIPEPGANAVTAHALTDHGIELSATHNTYPDEQWGHREILTSTDERFRPVNAYAGPDGYLYVTDMYRGILQHHLYVTTFLRKQILERGLDQPVGLGRIWRLVPDEPKPDDAHAPVNLADLSTRALIYELNSPNGWRRDTAQRLLVQGGDPSAIEPLRSMATYGDNHLGRIHALWTLHGLGAINPAIALQTLTDPHPRVRIAAAQTAEGLADSESRDLLLERFVAMTRDRDEPARLQAMLTLGAFNDDPRATGAMTDLLLNDPENPYLRGAAISGLMGRELLFLQEVLAATATNDPSDGLQKTIGELAGTIMRRREAPDIEGLLQLVASLDPNQAWRQTALLNGITGSSKNPKPIKLSKEPGAFLTMAAAGNGLAKKARAMITWDGDGEAASTPRVAPLSAEEKQLFDHGKMVYMVVCMACHQVTGKGQAGMAPSLVQTDYVLGSKERLTRIALNGLQGPVMVNDEEWNLVMPGHRENPAANDKNLAATLTYIRRSWGNEASAVSPEEVAKIRAATDGRVDLYTAEELQAFK